MPKEGSSLLVKRTIASVNAEMWIASLGSQ